jgi:hypothetical protein
MHKPKVRIGIPAGTVEIYSQALQSRAKPVLKMKLLVPFAFALNQNSIADG